MIKLFLDTEFNGFGGKLISMALVPEDPGLPEFYKELIIDYDLHPWVKENVIPHLFMVPTHYNLFQIDLKWYLESLGSVMIVADWPDDIRHFCEALIVGPGMMLGLTDTLRFELNRSIEYVSEVPHNALYDARAIRNSYGCWS
jgi:hypothetical protein